MPWPSLSDRLAATLPELEGEPPPLTLPDDTPVSVFELVDEHRAAPVEEST